MKDKLTQTLCPECGGHREEFRQRKGIECPSCEPDKLTQTASMGHFDLFIVPHVEPSGDKTWTVEDADGDTVEAGFLSKSDAEDYCLDLKPYQKACSHGTKPGDGPCPKCEEKWSLQETAEWLGEKVKELEALTETDKLELELAENTVAILYRLHGGDFDRAAEQRGIVPEELVAAAIVEMCRQAFTGEWEEAE